MRFPPRLRVGVFLRNRG